MIYSRLTCLNLCSRHPEVKWAQREDKLYITVLLADAKDAKVNLEPEGTFTFSAATGAGNQLYELKLDLSDKVNVEVRICLFPTIRLVGSMGTFSCMIT